MSTKVQSSLGVSVEVTADAAERIVERGGRLYLWQAPVGSAWLQDRADFRKPDGIAFCRIPAGLISVMVAEDLVLPETLTISTHRLVPKRVNVQWDEKTWGWRGGADDPGGGG
jgi:hypothetical protein